MDHSGTDIDSDTLSRLAELDRRGFILAPGAAPAEFIAAAEETLRWAAAIQETLRAEGRAKVLGEEFRKEQAVPEEILNQCLAPAADRYRVCPQWVPSFFSSKLLPWYVGGACFYFTDDNNVLRVCFVLSERFRESGKWLLYSRKEIISHEICHVARSMMDQNTFEEPLAYRISESPLRRGLGPMFRGTWEATTILAGSVILLLGSTAEALGAPRGIKYLASVPLIATSAFLALRAVKAHNTLSKAAEKLSPVYGDNAEAVLFRCTDGEIRELACASDTRRSIERYLNGEGDYIKWAVISRLFGQA